MIKDHAKSTRLLFYTWPRNRFVALFPVLCIIGLFFFVPLAAAVIFPFTDMTVRGGNDILLLWVGLNNFKQILRDGEFWSSLRATCVYFLVAVFFGQTLPGLMLALLFSTCHPFFRRMLKVVVCISAALPEIVTALTWHILLSGVVFSLPCMSPCFFSSPFSGLVHTDIVRYFPFLLLSMASIWRGTAFSLLFYEVALRHIPPSLWDMASVDGLSSYARFRYILFPSLRNVIFVNMLLLLLISLSDFTLVYVMVGASNLQTELLMIYQYRQGVQFYQAGYACVLSLFFLGVGMMIIFSLLPGRSRAFVKRML